MTYDSNLLSYDEYLTAVSNQSNTCVTAPSTGIQYNYYGNSVIDPSAGTQYNYYGNNSQSTYYSSTMDRYEIEGRLLELNKRDELLEERFNSLLTQYCVLEDKYCVLEDKCKDLANRCKDLEEFKEKVAEGTPLTKLDKEDMVFESLFDAVVSLDTEE
jgi:hypothetical protein